MSLPKHTEITNFVILLIAAFLFTGCGQTLKNSWGNFKAYYNTYYNAQESFRTGLKQVQDQPLTLNPSEPVRIHHAPVQAGGSDFQEAIEKGAKVLRKFPDTKWVDDAILLIGKSYYYRREFHSALQKFEELRNATVSPEMEQLSIIWKGRTMLDLNLHAEGITFLESELEDYPQDWSEARKAEIQTLAGEHHAMLENWEEAADWLTNAVSGVEDNIAGRTYFLYGQVLERLERYGEAYFAFSRVSQSFPGFEYSYWARFKQADISRKENSFDLALSIYEELSMDDKNIDRLSQLEFEIAHTLEMKGEVAEAEKRYKDLLYGRQSQNIQDLRADIYYRLGEIYSEEYDKVAVAAAYFDSSSTSSQSLTRGETSLNPQDMADTYGKYERLQNTINRADSLLRLGSLSPAQLDSALEEIKAQKQKELLEQEQLESESQSQQMMVNRNLTSTDQNTTSSSEYGFLNHRNSNRVNQLKAEFRVIWGNRPLVDNWRSLSILRSQSVSRDQLLSEKNQKADLEEQDATVVIDVEEIPRTPEDREELNFEKTNAQYELGNLLFLNLNSPDEARQYFYKVINSSSGGELRPRAMYSLYELYNTEDFADEDSLRYWQNRILEEYSDSRYARRISGDHNLSESSSTEGDSSRKLIQQFRQISNNSAESKGPKLRELALANRSSEIAPYIHYQAIESYIEEAKAFDKIADTLAPFIFEVIADTSMSAESAAEPSYTGAFWDSVRIVVQEFDTTFSDADQHQKVARLGKILKKEESSPQRPTCEDLNISLSIEGGMNEFLSDVSYPENVKDMSISGQVVYSFVVSPEGEIDSYELVSQRTSLGIEESFERAFEQSLRFEPLEMQDPPQVVECEITFPIKL